MNFVLVAAAKPSDESIYLPTNKLALYYEIVGNLNFWSELFLSRQLTFSPTVCTHTIKILPIMSYQTTERSFKRSTGLEYFTWKSSMLSTWIDFAENQL